MYAAKAGTGCGRTEGDCGDNVPELVGGGSGLEYESNGDGEDEAATRARPACRENEDKGEQHGYP